MSDTIEQNLAKISGKSPDEAKTAWEFAKNQAKQKYTPDAEEYYPYAVELVRGMLGDENNMGQEEKPSLFPSDSDSAMQQTSLDNSMFGEHISAACNKIKEWNSDDLSSLLNELRDGSLVKTYEQAIAFYHMVEANASTDPWDWVLTSNDKQAKAIVYYKKTSFSLLFDFVNPSSMYWMPQWNAIKNKRNLDQIVKLTIGQLDGDGNKVKNIPLNKSASFYSDTTMITLIVKVIKSYQKVWGRSKFQALLYTDNSNLKVSFLDKLKKELDTARINLKYDEDLSDEFTAVHNTSDPQLYYLFINSNGKKIKEDNEGMEEEDGTCMSSDFGDSIPADAAHKWKDDGNDLNKQAQDSMKKMGMIEAADRSVLTIAYTFPAGISGLTNITDISQTNGLLSIFGRGVANTSGMVKLGNASTDHSVLERGIPNPIRFYYGYSRDTQTVYISPKNRDGEILKSTAVIKSVLSEIFNKYKLAIAAGKRLTIKESTLLEMAQEISLSNNVVDPKNEPVKKTPNGMGKKSVKESADLEALEFGEDDYILLAQQIASDLSYVSGIKMGLIPFGYTTQEGMIAYKVLLGTSEKAITLEFDEGDLKQIGQLASPDSDVTVKTIDLSGYPIETVQTEISKQLLSLVNKGSFQDIKPPVKEARTANDSFDTWMGTMSKPQLSKLLTTERIKTVYETSYLVWAKKHDLPPTTYVTFYNKSTSWLNTNNLQNTYARKTVVIDQAGKVTMIDVPDEEKSWKILLTDSYKIQIEGMKMAVSNIVAGAFNSVYITGSAGVGKTHTVRAYLKQLGVTPIYVSGLVKDVESLATLLYTYRDNSVFVFDDTSLLKNKAFREILLAILDDKPVRYVSYYERKNLNRQKRNKIADQFEFTSGVIFIGNEPPSGISKEIKSRTSIVPVDLDKDQMMSLIYDNLDAFMPAIPREIKQYVFEWLLKNLKDFQRIDYRMMKTATGFLLGCRQAGDNSNKWEIFAKNSLGLN